MALSAEAVDVFEAARGRLEAIAYRLLGSAGDAEDAVQDAFLRWQAADRERIRVPEAWLTTVVTHLCLNQLTSARARREVAVGAWLPEPLPDGDPILGPAETVEQRESVSFAFLSLMERLSPQERAVYVLREAFGYRHAEIAGMLDLTEVGCQQLLHRARQHVAAGRVRERVDAAVAGRIAEEFLLAGLSGDTAALVRLLTDDAVSVADGGGKMPVRPTPIAGGLAIARFLRGLFRPNEARRNQLREATGADSVALHVGTVNAGPALIVVAGGRVISVMALQVTADGIAGIHVQADPDKLGRMSRAWAATNHGEPLGTMW